MGKFRQTSTELLPFIYVKKLVLVLCLEHYLINFLQILNES